MRSSEDSTGALPATITIGERAARSGVAPSALRFYEERGLLRSSGTDGHQRRHERSALRTVAVIRAAQATGLSLEEIAEALAALPGGRTPTLRDWARLSRSWRRSLNDRIAALEGLRDQRTSCIGCGCLSLQRCALFNRDGRAAGRGPGARYLLGDTPDE